VCQDGTLGIDIENIVLNVPTADTTAASAADTIHQGSSVKKRKFSAIASTPKANVQK
jgi:hypothetical protein